MTTKVYRIPDMHCTNCAMTLESIADDLEGVMMVKASYRHQTLQVEFDESQVSEIAILQVIKALRYTPVPIEA